MCAEVKTSSVLGAALLGSGRVMSPATLAVRRDLGPALLGIASEHRPSLPWWLQKLVIWWDCLETGVVYTLEPPCGTGWP